MQNLSEWGEFLAAFAIFFLSHTLPVRPAVKSRITAKIGALGFTVVYSALSIMILTWIISAAGRAPYVELWSWKSWHNHVPLTGMAAACVIIAMAFGQPNPLSFGGWNNGCFDPEDPGIIGWIRHPLLVGLLIWSGTHLVPNGNLAHVVVFGLFAAFSVLGLRIIDRRMRRNLGPKEWQRLCATRRELRITGRGINRVIIGLIVYMLILFSHEWFIGVTPLP